MSEEEASSENEVEGEPASVFERAADSINDPTTGLTTDVPTVAEASSRGSSYGVEEADLTEEESEDEEQEEQEEQEEVEAVEAVEAVKGQGEPGVHSEMNESIEDLTSEIEDLSTDRFLGEL
mmetsp:Transcript_41727/g.63752  ORF Transcript_41727/g.63752 Transcript_41727/m.63752 type:complete len:122 (+) Transcript_41727:2410-2775(+)